MKIVLLRDIGGELIARGLQHELGCEVKLHTLATSPSDLDQNTIIIVWPSAIMRIGPSLTGDGQPEAIEAAANEFGVQLADLSRRSKFVLVANLAFEPERPGMGLMTYRSGGDRFSRDWFNVNLAKAIEKLPNTYLIDSSRWFRRAGEQEVRLKRQYIAKSELSSLETRIAISDIAGVLRARAGEQKRVIVLDLDNTLWGGVLGDIGSEKIALGGHDAVGEAFRHFQAELLQLKRRGFLLAIVSKNNEETALHAIDSHPEMILRRDSFVTWRINWENKAENIVSISQELNLPLQHFLFIDDNSFERGLVREMLPQVLTPDWPEDPFSFVEALWGLHWLNSTSHTEEDRSRSDMYIAERVRSDEREHDYHAWLKSAQFVLSVEALGPDNLLRAHQLLSKTNQFNLSARRLTIEELRSPPAGHAFLCFGLSDRFGNYGLIGLMGLTTCLSNNSVTITDFVLSCRAFDRGVEDAMVACLPTSGTTVTANFVKTAKNQKSMAWLSVASGCQEHEVGCAPLTNLQSAAHISVRKTAPALKIIEDIYEHANSLSPHLPS